VTTRSNRYLDDAERRQRCATIPDIFVMGPPSIARSAVGDLGSYGTIAGKRRSARKGALTSSGLVAKPTASGCACPAPPDEACIIPCIPSETRHEICSGQRQEALRPACLRDVRETYYIRLPAGDRNSPHLLQSRLLLGPLQQRHWAPRRPKGVMKTCRSTRTDIRKDHHEQSSYELSQRQAG
jgi:hypothetical protein